MLVALIMVAVVAASLLFHFLSPWRLTPIASNWGYIDNMMGATFWITAAGFVAVILFMAYCLFRFRHIEGRRAAYEPENQKLEGWLAIGTTLAVVALLAPGLFVWGQFINVPEGAGPAHHIVSGIFPVSHGRSPETAQGFRAGREKRFSPVPRTKSEAEGARPDRAA